MLLHPTPKKLSASGRQSPKPQSLSLQADQQLSSRFRAALQTLDLPLPPSSGDCPLQLSTSSPVHGYRLRITPSSITLEAESEQLAYHGLVTLRQVLAQEENHLPELEIEDWPDLENRGYMLDISRCKVPTMATLFELVDQLASLKFNQLQLYTEHAFAYRNHEEVWADASPITAEEIQELDLYCYHRYIELVPNQNTFGHMERWLKHSAYRHLAECPEGFEHPLAGRKSCGSTLKPNAESLAFVSELFDELLPNFRSRQCNIGGDEPWELGQGWSREQVAQQGKQRVYLDHLLKICRNVGNRGYVSQFWGDIILEQPELAAELPGETVGLLWGYEADHPFAQQCQAFQQAGKAFYVVPGTSTWNAIGGRLGNALPNIRRAARNAIQHEGLGLLLTDWGDSGHHQSSLTSLLPLLYAAGVSWGLADNMEPDLDTVATKLIHGNLLPRHTNALRQLSAAGEVFQEPLPNATWLNKLLFATERELPEIVAKLNETELLAAQEILDTIALETDDSWQDRDLLGACQLLRHACAKGLATIRKQTVPALPFEQVEEFRNNWLLRNRPGGLEEAADNLAKAD